MKIRLYILLLSSLFQLPCATGQQKITGQLNVQVITDEADAVLRILEKREQEQEITDSDWQAVFSSEGYMRLKKRELSMSRPFEDSAFRSFVLSDSLLQKRKVLAETLSEWKSADIKEIAKLSFAYLPEGSGIRAKVYPVIKPKRNSFVFEYPDNPAIFLYLDPAASRKKFEATLAHELHHIGFGSGCSTKEEKEKREKLSPAMQKVLDWLSSMGEGFATLAAVGSPDVNPYTNIFLEESANWDKDVADYNTHFKTLEKFFIDVSEGRLSEKEISQTGFSFFGVAGRSGLWYTVGWQMCVVIEKTFGRPKLVEVMCNRTKLLSVYNKAARKYNRRNKTHLATWSKELVRKMK